MPNTPPPRLRFLSTHRAPIEASDRNTRLLAFAGLTILLASTFLGLAFFSWHPHPLAWVRVASALFTIALALWPIWVARRGASHAQLVRTGAAFLIAVSFSISLSRHAEPWSLEVRGASGVAILMVLFPVILPCPARRTLGISLMALLAAIAAFALTIALGNPWPGWPSAVECFRAELAAVPVAAFVASVIYGLGQQLEQARQLGAYQLEACLDRGGMGEVWRARHAMLVRPAAVKLIRQDVLEKYADQRDALIARFEREVQATSALRNPHTVEVYDFGRTADGTFYYVMEFLEGVNLQELVKRYGPLPPERAVFLLLQVCASLGEAHNKGLVHRDIKPSNLFVCEYGDEFDYIKVVDFGLVTDNPHEPIDERLTLTGQMHGTPAYMAPEQAKGSLAIDPRTDLYALGCVAYWLLCGRPPFRGETAFEVAAKHINVPPPGLPPEVPQALAQLVTHCMAKDPADRPASARALAEALRAVPFDQPWDEERALLWWMRNRQVGRRVTTPAAPRRTQAPPTVSPTTGDWLEQ